MFAGWNRLWPLLLLLGLVLEAFAAPPELGIQVDQNAYNRDSPYLVFSTKLTYSRETDASFISDDDLWALAKQGYAEMKALWK